MYYRAKFIVVGTPWLSKCANPYQDQHVGLREIFFLFLTINKNANYIFVILQKQRRPPMWSSGQSSWLQIRRPGFDSRHYQIFWKKKKERKKTVVGLERGPLSLVSTN
jgi:hypothetical protein